MSISSQSFLEYINNTNIVPIAHRGASFLASENSFASFRMALDLGYRVIETDIHSSKDGTAYIFHDNTLERLTGENLKISNLKDIDIDCHGSPSHRSPSRLRDIRRVLVAFLLPRHAGCKHALEYHHLAQE